MKKFYLIVSLLCCYFIFSGCFSNIQAQEEIIEEEIIQESTPKKDKKPAKQEEIIQEQIMQETNRKKSVKEIYYRDKYEQTYNYPFEVVWNAIKQSLEDIQCQVGYERYNQDDEGLYKGSIKSDFCVFSLGKDTTFATLKKYSLEVPYIRGGIWLNGRMQYHFRLTEQSDGTVYLHLTGKISGFEDFVTHEVQFWESNGIFETQMLERIEKNCKLLNE